MRGLLAQLGFLSATLIATVCLLLAESSARAAPTLIADPYPAGANQPDSASMKVDGGVAVPCTLKAVTGGLQPTCDLSGIAAGTHQIVMMVEKNNACTVTGAGVAGTCTVYMMGVTGNFSYTSVTVSVPAPTNRTLSPQ